MKRNYETLLNFLGCATPKEWLEASTENLEILLLDHTQCEKKAAATAVQLMFRYDRQPLILHELSRLAREELRHFEQMLVVLKNRKIAYQPLSPSRYAEGLRKHAIKHDPTRLIDLLIIGAFIEARSCERFFALIPYLKDLELAKFYERLAQSEFRHHETYLMLAKKISGIDLSDRIAFFKEKENELILSADEVFRFHSGVV